MSRSALKETYYLHTKYTQRHKIAREPVVCIDRYDR